MPPDLTFTYLYRFRRIVVSLAFVGAMVGWVAQVPWLVTASVTIGIGEWLETSYYLGVLRWGQQHPPPPTADGASG